jgi:hypothetical protein
MKAEGGVVINHPALLAGGKASQFSQQNRPLTVKTGQHQNLRLAPRRNGPSARAEAVLGVTCAGVDRPA